MHSKRAIVKSDWPLPSGPSLLNGVLLPGDPGGWQRVFPPFLWPGEKEPRSIESPRLPALIQLESVLADQRVALPSSSERHCDATPRGDPDRSSSESHTF